MSLSTSASLCGFCKALESQYNRLSDQYSDKVGSLKLIVDDNRSTGGPSAMSSLGRQDSQGYHDESVSIPLGSGTIIEVTFPEPGTYFGTGHDVGSILYGAGFVVIAE